MERSLIYNESRELLAELKTTRLYIEKCKSVYASQMDEFQVKLDNGLISSDYAVDTFMESADNGLLGRIKLAFMKIKESFIKFIDKVILRLKECAMISRLKKAKDEINKLEVWLPKTYTVKFSDETIKQVSVLFDTLLKGLAPFKELDSDKVTKGINTLEVEINKITKKIEREVAEGVIINPKKLPSCIDQCISDIENISKFRAEFISTYDKVVSLLKYEKRLDDAVICEKGLNSFVISLQKMTNTVIRYSGDVVRASASLIADAKKAKDFQKSQFESVYVPDNIMVISAHFEKLRGDIDKFVSEATEEYINKINEMQVKIDSDELISEYAIDLYNEKADNTFVDKIKIAVIKIRDSLIRFIDGIIEKVNITALKRKYKNYCERYNACRYFIQAGETFKCNSSPKTIKSVKAIGTKLSEAFKRGAKYIYPDDVDNVVANVEFMEKALQEGIESDGTEAVPAVWISSLSGNIDALDGFLSDKKMIVTVCNDVVRLLKDDKRTEDALNCQRALSELSRMYHKLILVTVSVTYDLLHTCEKIINKGESEAVKKM